MDPPGHGGLTVGAKTSRKETHLRWPSWASFQRLIFSLTSALIEAPQGVRLGTSRSFLPQP